MAKVTSKIKTRTKIVGATATAIFTLASVFTATWAWFAANQTVSTDGMQVTIMKVTGAECEDIKMIKFEYGFDKFCSIDYMHPENGAVFSYDYDEESGTFPFDGWVVKKSVTFGNQDPTSETTEFVVKKIDETRTLYQKVNSNWVNKGTISALENPPTASTEGSYCVCNNVLYAKESKSATMNVYDPIEGLINGGNLIGLNCNAIYQVSFSAAQGTYKLGLIAKTRHKEREISKIWLSDYIDIDIFYSSDLSSVHDTYSNSSAYGVGEFIIRTVEGQEKLYCCQTAIKTPEAFNADHWVLIDSPSEETITYHKISYLSSQLAEHKHFYADNYSNSKAGGYPAGSLVSTGESVLYKCVTSISEMERFDCSKWEAQTNIDVYELAPGVSYGANDLVKYGNRFYKCITPVVNNDWNEVGSFAPSTAYAAGALILNNGSIYSSKVAFTSESSFNESDWNLLAAPLSSSNAYAFGNYCLYNNMTYKCENASAASSWSWADTPEFSNEATYDENKAVIYNDDIYVSKESVAAGEWNETQWIKKWSRLDYSRSKAYEVGDLIVVETIEDEVPVYSYYRCANDLRNTFDASHWQLIPAYSDQQNSYTAGIDYVSYDSTVYTNASAVAEGTPWNPNQWTPTNRPAEITVVDQSENQEVEFVYNNETGEVDTVKVYINVNYSDKKAQSFIKSLYSDIEAVSDYYFDFGFVLVEDGND